MTFEWDDLKRESNMLKHHLDFARAEVMFDEEFVYAEAPSAFGDETRWLRTGIVHGEFVTVVWTRRDDRIRIISFRRASRDERREYLKVHIE